MNRICLVVLIGLPGVGKTTACQYMMQKESLPFNILHLCYDHFIKFNSENPTEYKEQRRLFLKSVNSFIQKLKDNKNLLTELQAWKNQYKDNQRNDVIILCDDNHYYRSMRYKLFQLARDYSIGYCQIYFNCSEKLAVERNSSRCSSTVVPNDLIVQMGNRLEVPNSIDYKWEENTLSLQNFNFYENDWKEIITYIVQILNKPQHFLQKSLSKSKTQQSKIHELDLLLRKRLNTLMSSKLRPDTKVFAKTLNDKRKDILKQYQINMVEQSLHHLDFKKYVEMLNNV